MKHTTLLTALILLIGMTRAFAQTTPVTPNIRLMSTEQPTTAFFYQKPVVLDREQNKGLRLNEADAHMLSLRNLRPLLERSQPAMASKPARKSKANTS